MTKLQKNSTRELIQISRGITSLLSAFLSDTDEQFSNDVLFDIFKVVNLQKEIQDEIEARLPFNILESPSNREEVSNEKGK